jgi:predicted HNH restriction endonuclease
LAQNTIFHSQNLTTCNLPELNFVGLGMFIGKKKNKSGKVSVRVIQKVNRTNQLLKTIGCSSDSDEIKRFIVEAHQWIEEPPLARVCNPQLAPWFARVLFSFTYGLQSNIKA